jgi:hypothetical protein
VVIRLREGTKFSGEAAVRDGFAGDCEEDERHGLAEGD